MLTTWGRDGGDTKKLLGILTVKSVNLLCR